MEIYGKLEKQKDLRIIYILRFSSESERRLEPPYLILYFFNLL